jgi:ribonuclease HI
LQQKKSCSEWEVKKATIHEGRHNKHIVPIYDSISVDGSCLINPGTIEYQGIFTSNKEIIFREGPFQRGTNNIAEFLAIVHALEYCEQNRISIPIYTDSVTAMSWVKHKTVRCSYALGVELSFIVQDAVAWLNRHTWENKILKWYTNTWGENPADFGRK